MLRRLPPPFRAVYATSFLPARSFHTNRVQAAASSAAGMKNMLGNPTSHTLTNGFAPVIPGPPPEEGPTGRPARDFRDLNKRRFPWQSGGSTAGRTPEPSPSRVAKEHLMWHRYVSEIALSLRRMVDGSGCERATWPEGTPEWWPNCAASSATLPQKPNSADVAGAKAAGIPAVLVRKRRERVEPYCENLGGIAEILDG